MLLSEWRGRLSVSFPHGETESGETLGSDEDDERARRYAQSFVAHIDAQDEWRRYRADAREEWRPRYREAY